MADESLDRNTDQRPATPRWVKLLGITIAVAVAVAIAVMLLSGGQHGPGQHTGAFAPSLSFG